MGGGILQLVATGIQDLYITGDPQISWFKILYRRHTEFSMVDHPIKINGDLTFGETHMIKIPPIADKLNRLSLVVDVPTPSLKMKPPTVQTITDIVDDYDIVPIFNPPKLPTDTVKYDDLFNNDPSSLGESMVNKAHEYDTIYDARLDVLDYTKNTYTINTNELSGRYIAFVAGSIDLSKFSDNTSNTDKTIDPQGYIMLTYQKTKELIQSPNNVVNLDETSFIYYQKPSNATLRNIGPIEMPPVSTTEDTNDFLTKIFPRAVDGYTNINQLSDLSSLDVINKKYHIILSIDHIRNVKDRNVSLRDLYQNDSFNFTRDEEESIRQTELNIERNRLLMFTNFSYPEMLDNSTNETGVYNFNIDPSLPDNEYYDQLNNIVNGIKVTVPVQYMDVDLINDKFNRYDININAFYDPNYEITTNINTNIGTDTDTLIEGMLVVDMILYDSDPDMQSEIIIVDDTNQTILINPQYIRAVPDKIGFAPHKIIRRWDDSINKNTLVQDTNNNPTISSEKVENLVDGMSTISKIFSDYYSIPSISNVTNNINNMQNINLNDIENLHKLLLAIYDDVRYTQNESRNYKVDNIHLYNAIEIRNLMYRKLIKDIIYVDQLKTFNLSNTITKYYRRTTTLNNAIVNDAYVINSQYTTLSADPMVFNRDIVYSNAKFLMWSYYLENIYLVYDPNIDNVRDIQAFLDRMSYMLYYLPLDPTSLNPADVSGIASIDPSTQNVRFSKNTIDNVTDVMIYDDNTIIENYDDLHRSFGFSASSVFTNPYIYAGERYDEPLKYENEKLFEKDTDYTYPVGYRTCINREVEFYHVIDSLDHTNVFTDETVYDYFIRQITDTYSDPRNYLYTVSFRTTEQYLRTYFKDTKIINAPLSMDQIGNDILSLIVKTINSSLINYIKLIFSIWKNSSYLDTEYDPQLILRFFIGSFTIQSSIDYNANYVTNDLQTQVTDGKLTQDQADLGDPILLRAKHFVGTNIDLRPIMGYSYKYALDLSDTDSFVPTGTIMDTSHFVDTVKDFVNNTKFKDTLSDQISIQAQQVKSDMEKIFTSKLLASGLNYIYWRDTNYYLNQIFTDINTDIGTQLTPYYPNVAVLNHLPLMMTYYYGRFMQRMFNTNLPVYQSSNSSINGDNETNIGMIRYEIYPIEDETQINNEHTFDVEPDTVEGSFVKFLGTDVRLNPRCPFHSYIDNLPLINSYTQSSNYYMTSNIIDYVNGTQDSNIDMCPHCFKTIEFRNLLKLIMPRTVFTPTNAGQQYVIIDDSTIKSLSPNTDTEESSLVSSNTIIAANSSNTLGPEYVTYLYRPEDVISDDVSESYFHLPIEFMIHRVVAILLRYKKMILDIISRPDFNTWVINHIPTAGQIGPANPVDGKTELDRYNDFISYLNLLQQDNNKDIFDEQMLWLISAISQTDTDVSNFNTILGIYDLIKPAPVTSVTAYLNYTEAISFIGRKDNLQTNSDLFGLIPNVFYEKLDIVNSGVNIVRYQFYRGNIILWTLLQHAIIRSYNTFFNNILDPREILKINTLDLTDIINFVKTPKTKDKLTSIKNNIVSRNLSTDLYNEVYSLLQSGINSRFVNTDDTIDYYRCKQTNEYAITLGLPFIDDFNESISASMINYCRQIMIYFNMLLSRYNKLKFLLDVKNISLNDNTYYYNFSQIIAEAYFKDIIAKVQTLKVVSSNPQDNIFIRNDFYYIDTSKYYFINATTFRNKQKDQNVIELVNDFLVFDKDNNYHLSQCFTLNQLMNLLRSIGIRDANMDIYDNYNGLNSEINPTNTLTYYNNIGVGLTIKINNEFTKYVSVDTVTHSLNNYNLFTYENGIVYSTTNGFNFSIIMKKVVDDGVYNRVWYYLPTISNMLYDSVYTNVSLEAIPNTDTTDDYFEVDTITRRTYTKGIVTSPYILIRNKMTYAIANIFMHTPYLKQWERDFHDKYGVVPPITLLSSQTDNEIRKSQEIKTWEGLLNAYEYFVGNYFYSDVTTAFDSILKAFSSGDGSLFVSINDYELYLTRYINSVENGFTITNSSLRVSHLLTTLTVGYMNISGSLNDIIHKHRDTLGRILLDVIDIQKTIHKLITDQSVLDILDGYFNQIRTIFIQSINSFSQLDFANDVQYVKTNINTITTKDQLQTILFTQLNTIKPLVDVYINDFNTQITNIVMLLQENNVIFISSDIDTRVFTPEKLFNNKNLKLFNNLTFYTDILYLILGEIINTLTPTDTSITNFLTYTSGKSNYYNLTAKPVNNELLDTVFITSIDSDNLNPIDTYNMIIQTIKLTVTSVLNPMSQIAAIDRYIDITKPKVDTFYRYDLDKIILSSELPSYTFRNLNHNINRNIKRNINQNNKDYDRYYDRYYEYKQNAIKNIEKTPKGMLDSRARGIRRKNETFLRSMLKKAYLLPRLRDINNIENSDQIIQTYVGSPVYEQIIRVLKQKQPNHAWVRYLGYRMIEEVSLVIDGEQIDMNDGELLVSLHKMFGTKEHDRGVNIMLGNIPEMYEVSDVSKPSLRLYIQFYMFFGKDYGASLPLVNMLYSDIQIRLKLRPLNELLYIERGAELSKPIKFKTQMLGNFIYLSDDERKTCATTKSEMIMERYATSGTFVRSYTDLIKTMTSNDGITRNVLRFRYHFNDLCKYLFWKIQVVYPEEEMDDTDKIYWDLADYRVRQSGEISVDSKVIEVVKRIMIEFNGQTREQWKEMTYYRLLQPYNKYINGLDYGEGIYSMCLFPKLVQPSGATNVSKLQDIDFFMEINDDIVNLMNTLGLKIKVTMWNCAYNIFTSFSGFGALRFYSA